jgi:hypothetical protein
MFQQQQSVPFFDTCPVIHPMNIISGCVDLIRSCLIMFSWYNTHTQIGCFFWFSSCPRRRNCADCRQRRSTVGAMPCRSSMNGRCWDRPGPKGLKGRG